MPMSPHPHRLEPVPAPLYDPRFEHDACGVGFVADTAGSHADRVVPMALEALAALAHRGARAADERTGDGSGISMPITSAWRRRILREADVRLAPRAQVAIGMCFVPAAELEASQRAIERDVAGAGLRVAGWRRVPVRDELVADRRVGETPAILQAIVVPNGSRLSSLAFARRLAAARRSIEAASPGIAIPSLSERTIVYKGLFVGDELGAYYADLGDGDLAVPYALFHQRYSTNTFPSWRLAQPFRYVAHNGEINTIRANREAMRGRRRWLGRGQWARRLAAIGPLVSADGSDSESLDDALELLVLAGMPIEAALAELVPAAGGLGGDEAAPRSTEPWDGPAALVFADGRTVGCMLDRNGLRPLAMAATHDGLIIVSSEAGSIELAPERVVRRHRLGPGEMVTVNLASGAVRGPGIPTGRPVPVPSPRPMRPAPERPEVADVRVRVAHGVDAEIMRQIVKPMATEGHEPTWSMGDDTPIAPLARQPRRVTAFLRQAFAQVTNPAIDPDRERAVMSLAMTVGRQARLTEDDDGRSAVRIDGPVLDDMEWARLRASFEPRQLVVLDATWPRRDGAGGLVKALARIGRQARAAERRGARLIILSDHQAGPRRIAIPSILAVGRAHQALVAAGRRPACDIAVECGDAFDVHDVAMLVASGASAIHPWLLLQLADEQAGARGTEDLTTEVARTNVVTALETGLRKILARMGVSTLASYRGGQMFDVLGLDRAVADACFPAASGWPGAVGMADIGANALARHGRAYADPLPKLEDPGLVRFRGSGETHAHAPRTVKALQALVAPDADASDALAAYRATLHDLGARQPRDMLSVQRAGPPLPLDEVEPASRIARRFVSAAMSLGALSPEAHQTIAIGMARLGGAANSGEGGEDPAWYAPEPNGDRRDAAIKQVASARFGVTAEYLARAEQLEIKIAQGSKPGEGGQLPGRKVTPFIASLRRGQAGTTMISPPPHHDIYSIEDLAQLISDLRAVNPSARIGVKLVAGAGIGTIAAGVAKARADYIMVSGHAGGTGASPLSSIKHVGLPWELGLAETHQVLVRNRLRDRVALRTDGGLQSGRDVVVAALLGAEEFGFGTAALVAIGCDMARQCHLDTCPTGIATQREDLRAKFAGRPEDVVAFFMAIAEDVRRELAAVGLRSIGAAVGRADLLRIAGGAALSLGAIAAAPAWSPHPASRDVPPRDREIAPDRPAVGGAEALRDEALASRVADGVPVLVHERVTPRDRSIGAGLAGILSRRPEPRQLPHVAYELSGSAGQSLGAFAVAGMRITVRGEANDYVAKGLSGGTVVVRPPDGVEGDDHALAGNVCLFGATAGALHVVGRAGMRFAVRNSGARAVVEGIGAHGCEYMTGGTVVVLGPVGPNFGAGMTGGCAFLLDVDEGQVNATSVGVRPPTEDEERSLSDLLTAHAEEGSRLARSLLADWEGARRRFSAVEPVGSEVSAVPQALPQAVATAR